MGAGPKRMTALAAILALMASAPALAQEAGEDTHAQAAQQIYTPADLARFAPSNALDMLVQVPAFTIRREDQTRGLGEASANVLINGERITTKSEGIDIQL